MDMNKGTRTTRSEHEKKLKQLGHGKDIATTNIWISENIFSSFL